MSIERTKLPYDYDALEPHISSETMHYHYEKHYSGYVDRLRDLVSSTPLSHLALDQIVSRARESGAVDILDNALQVWNHEFLWQSMSPSGETQPEGRIKSLVEENFGDVAAFKRRFRKAAMSQFGSGWVWLVQEGDRLRLLTTSNAESPLGTEGHTSADSGSLGARLLSGLSQRACPLRRCVPEQAYQLEVCGSQRAASDRDPRRLIAETRRRNFWNILEEREQHEYD